MRDRGANGVHSGAQPPNFELWGLWGLCMHRENVVPHLMCAVADLQRVSATCNGGRADASAGHPSPPPPAHRQRMGTLPGTVGSDGADRMQALRFNLSHLDRCFGHRERTRMLGLTLGK